MSMVLSTIMDNDKRDMLSIVCTTEQFKTGEPPGILMPEVITDDDLRSGAESFRKAKENETEGLISEKAFKIIDLSKLCEKKNVLENKL